MNPTTNRHSRFTEEFDLDSSRVLKMKQVICGMDRFHVGNLRVIVTNEIARSNRVTRSMSCIKEERQRSDSSEGWKAFLALAASGISDRNTGFFLLIALRVLFRAIR
jgi:hypothetical protein